jgi:hypothetical protein
LPQDRCWDSSEINSQFIVMSHLLPSRSSHSKISQAEDRVTDSSDFPGSSASQSLAQISDCSCPVLIVFSARNHVTVDIVGAFTCNHDHERFMAQWIHPSVAKKDCQVHGHHEGERIKMTRNTVCQFSIHHQTGVLWPSYISLSL